MNAVRLPVHPQPDPEAAFLALHAVGKVWQRPRQPPLVALDNVSFTLPERQVGVLLGPSGCGKSTLLRMVAGLDTPSSGEITLGGDLITDTGRDRGMVFQSYTSFPWLTVLQNVEYGLRTHGESLALKEGTAHYFIERVGLTPFKDAYPDQLSGGMRQRVAIARALATYPRLLLMDEPFGALDALTRGTIQDELMQIVRDTQQTVFMITHDVDEAILLADRILLMNNGADTPDGYKPGGIAEVVRNPLPRSRTRSGLHHLDDYYPLRNHIVDFLVSRATAH